MTHAKTGAYDLWRLKEKENSRLHYAGASLSENLFIQDLGTIPSSLSETAGLPRPATGWRMAASFPLPPPLPSSQLKGRCLWCRRTELYVARGCAALAAPGASVTLKAAKPLSQRCCSGWAVSFQVRVCSPRLGWRWKGNQVLLVPRLAASVAWSPWFPDPEREPSTNLLSPVPPRAPHQGSLRKGWDLLF